jgi:hypothetical protein
MTIEHRDAYRLGHELIRLYGFDTFGIEKEVEYKAELVGIQGLMQSLRISDVKTLLKPAPETDQRRSTDGSLFQEYQNVIDTIGTILQSGRTGEVYHSYCLGWYLPELMIALRNPITHDEQVAEQHIKSIRSACWNIRYFLRDGPRLPDYLNKRLEDITASSESTTNRSTKAYEIVDEISHLHNDLVKAFEAVDSNSQEALDTRSLPFSYSIFGLPDKKYTYDLFVLMPFALSLKSIYDDHIKKVAKTLNLTIARADDFFSQNSVMYEVWSAITQASILVADCTGKNPNVFYEIGIAHAIGKPVILITQNQDDVPFDLRHIRYIQYDYTPPGMIKFENTLTTTISEIRKDLGKDTQK